MWSTVPSLQLSIHIQAVMLKIHPRLAHGWSWSAGMGGKLRVNTWVWLTEEIKLWSAPWSKQAAESFGNGWSQPSVKGVGSLILSISALTVQLLAAKSALYNAHTRVSTTRTGKLKRTNTNKIKINYKSYSLQEMWQNSWRIKNQRGKSVQKTTFSLQTLDSLILYHGKLLNIFANVLLSETQNLWASHNNHKPTKSCVTRCN